MEKTQNNIPGPFELMSSYLVDLTPEEIISLKEYYNQKRLYSDKGLTGLRGKILKYHNDGNRDKVVEKLKSFVDDIKLFKKEEEIQRKRETSMAGSQRSLSS